MCSQSISANRSPSETVNTALPGGIFGSQQRSDNQSESSDHSSHTASGKDRRFGKHTNQYHPPHGYGYPPAQQPFAGTLQCYHQSQFNVTQFATNHQRKPTISKLRATVARIWPPPKWLWLVTNVASSAVWRTRAIISRYTESASKTTGKQSSQATNIFKLNFSTCISFWRTRETLHEPPYKMIPAGRGTTKTRCPRDYALAPIAADFQQQIWCSWWERWFIGLGWCRRQTPNQPEANWILFEAICQKHGAGQLQCVQQVEESMGSLVSAEEASVHYPGAEPLETALR